MTSSESPISLVLRDASRVQHEQAENSSFIVRLMNGELDLASYAAYLTQLAWLYRELETHTTTGEAFESSEPLWSPHLLRSSAIEHDLRALGVNDWPSSTAATPAMSRYCEHIGALGDRSDFRLIAHHYTRYLGDLSGGQAIARLVERHYGASADQLTFYSVEGIPEPVRFKAAYRDSLDSLPLSDDELSELVAEVQLAFTFNQNVFDDLDRGVIH
jgi:heme oxygenase